MHQPQRNIGSTLSNGYRYSFQGQESDNEIKGEGNSVNYKYRMHDPRIGRFFAVDPLSAKYPFYSPYVFSGNRVIDARELEGLEPDHLNSTVVVQTNLLPESDDPLVQNQNESIKASVPGVTDQMNQVIMRNDDAPLTESSFETFNSDLENTFSDQIIYGEDGKTYVVTGYYSRLSTTDAGEPDKTNTSTGTTTIVKTNDVQVNYVNVPGIGVVKQVIDEPLPNTVPEIAVVFDNQNSILIEFGVGGNSIKVRLDVVEVVLI